MELKNKSDKKKEGDDEINSRLSLGTLSFQPNFLFPPILYQKAGKYVSLISGTNLQVGSCCCKRVTKHDQVYSTRIHAKTRYIPSFSFMKQSLCRERSCQARDFHFSSSLTTEDAVSYCRFEAVGYDFNTIQLNQLSVAVSVYKPEISVYLEDYGFRERTFESLGEEGRPVMYHTFEKLGK
ncbi:hypothetical protein Bca52824_087587 [Brassica carinata]|uniref:Uncharacterized protein n=2 Tax=Brassica TaxID=3705 RepID=A0A8X7PE09_BRACI|nr:hypothetical protein Bca52824_087587 [Brassica carinata]